MEETKAVSSLMPRKDRPNILPLEGEIDLHVSPNVAETLRAMTRKKPRRLVIDLTRVTYVDSSALAVFIEGKQRVEAYGGKFALAGLHDDVRTILEMAKLDQIFRIFPDVDSALAAN
jgi:anti-anti-sigma factor